MLCTNRRCPPGAVQERPPRQENAGPRRSNGASVPAVPAVPSRSDGPFAAAHLPPRTEAHADSARLGRSAVNGTVGAAANQRPTGEGAGSGCGCGGCSRMQGPQRSPPPGPQPVGGAVPRRRRPSHQRRAARARQSLSRRVGARFAPGPPGWLDGPQANFRKRECRRAREPAPLARWAPVLFVAAVAKASQLFS